jgi:multisubunit Na+/H+ antiporter MnhG subunit
MTEIVLIASALILVFGSVYLWRYGRLSGEKGAIAAGFMILIVAVLLAVYASMPSAEFIE